MSPALAWARRFRPRRPARTAVPSREAGRGRYSAPSLLRNSARLVGNPRRLRVSDPSARGWNASLCSASASASPAGPPGGASPGGASPGGPAGPHACQVQGEENKPGEHEIRRAEGHLGRRLADTDDEGDDEERGGHECKHLSTPADGRRATLIPVAAPLPAGFPGLRRSVAQIPCRGRRRPLSAARPAGRPVRPVELMNRSGGPLHGRYPCNHGKWTGRHRAPGY
jgi:hypothetical protein